MARKITVVESVVESRVGMEDEKDLGAGGNPEKEKREALRVKRGNAKSLEW